MIYQKAVEELVNTEAKHANADVACMVGEVEVDEYVVPTLGECAPVTHHTHCQ